MRLLSMSVARTVWPVTGTVPTTAVGAGTTIVVLGAGTTAAPGVWTTVELGTVTVAAGDWTMVEPGTVTVAAGDWTTVELGTVTAVAGDWTTVVDGAVVTTVAAGGGAGATVGGA